MKKCLALILFLCSSFQVSFADESVEKIPCLIIKSVTNYSPYDLAFIDRSNNWYFILKAESKVGISCCIEDYENIVIANDLFEKMHEYAQVAIVKMEQNGELSNNNGSFLNMNVMPGGIDDGSGFVTGPVDSTIVKFLMVASDGSCTMSAATLKDHECNEIEIHISFSIDPENVRNNIFRIQGSFEIEEK
ncbi:MAG: hypothetical protein JO129_04835 [Candidatus Dependentiae bacterium]|nr:hypothetical protein [Candidatus Dependentiae bacterium]